ncbi:hypothetical protein [Mesorhizobium sp. Cs1321R2N1]|uniref:hypothetical protein n=1 Tax=Mesorhizobium sp. Cs1321R2N1 TaxID=3015174 RepID=UPI00301D4AE4
MVAATLVAKVTNDATPILPSIGIQSSFCAALFMLFALGDVGLRPPFQDPAFWFVVAWFIVFSTLVAFSFYWMYPAALVGGSRWNCALFNAGLL